MIKFYLEGKTPIESTQIEAVAEAIGSTLNLGRDVNIGLSFVDTKTIQDLNDKYAGNNYPTDVLSFDYKDGENPKSDGDVVVCTEIAEKQAKENDISAEAEISLLIAHGALHVLGYDHQNTQQVASLDAIQSDIMNKLNYEYRDFKWSH